MTLTILIAVVVVGALVWYFVGRKKEAKTPMVSEEIPPPATESSVPETLTPVSEEKPEETPTEQPSEIEMPSEEPEETGGAEEEPETSETPTV